MMAHPGERRVHRDFDLTCYFCHRPTKGMPAEGFTLGPRTAQTIQDGRVRVCPECVEHFDRILDEDDVERAKRQGGAFVSGHPQEQDRQAMKDDLVTFGRAVLHQTLTAVWKDGSTLYARSRGTVRRAVNAAALGLLGGAVGAVSGFLMRTEPPEPPTETERLLRTVRFGTVLRQTLPAVEQMFTQMEYDARKQLEEMGYYPCSECGMPHVKEERHHMPPGTYWDGAKERYVRPDDPEWSKEGYEQAAGERWDLEDETDNGSQMH